MVNENKMQGGNKGVLLTAEVQPRQEGSGRHGEGIGRGRKDPLHDELEPSRLSRFGSAIKGIGRVTVAALVFAGAVGFASCSGENKNENEDTDTVTETEMGTDTDSEIDTGSEDSDTGTGQFNACEEFQNDSIEDNQATVQEGGSLIVGPTGYWMQVVIADANNQLAEVHFMDEMFNPVDSNGNPSQNEEESYAVSTMDNPTLTVGFGGEEQEITICGVIETVDGKKLAMFVTNRAKGFMECDYVNSGSDSNPEEYQVSTWTMETIVVSTHHQGFVQGEAECPAEADSFFVQEAAGFDIPLPEQDNIPGEYFPTIKVRNNVFDLLAVLASQLKMRIAPTTEVARLCEGDSTTKDGLTVTYTGPEQNNAPNLAFAYEDVDQFQETAVSANEELLSMDVDGATKEFVLRYSTPEYSGLDSNYKSCISLQAYTAETVAFIGNGQEPLTINGTPYVSTISAVDSGVNQMVTVEYTGKK